MSAEITTIDLVIAGVTDRRTPVLHSPDHRERSGLEASRSRVKSWRGRDTRRRSIARQRAGWVPATTGWFGTARERVSSGLRPAMLMPFPCPSWKRTWSLGQVDHVGQSGVAEPAGDFVEGMPRHVSGSVPVERVAHADLGIGMHRDADGGQVEGDAHALGQPPSAGHQLSLEAADRALTTGRGARADRRAGGSKRRAGRS